MITFEAGPYLPHFAEQKPQRSAITELKQHTGQVLESLSEEIDSETHNDGGNFLRLAMTSIHENTGLSTGFLLVTDKSTAEGGNPAFQRRTAGRNYSYGVDTIDCVLIKELSEANFNVQELQWSRATRPATPQLTESGLANVNISEIMGSYRDEAARYQNALQLGVRAEDLVFSDGDANAEKIDSFFAEVLSPEFFDNLQPLGNNS